MRSDAALTFVGSGGLVFCVRSRDHTVYVNEPGLSLFVYGLVGNPSASASKALRLPA